MQIVPKRDQENNGKGRTQLIVSQSLAKQEIIFFFKMNYEQGETTSNLNAGHSLSLSPWCEHDRVRIISNSTSKWSLDLLCSH